MGIRRRWSYPEFSVLLEKHLERAIRNSECHMPKSSSERQIASDRLEMKQAQWMTLPQILNLTMMKSPCGQHNATRRLHSVLDRSSSAEEHKTLSISRFGRWTKHPCRTDRSFMRWLPGTDGPPASARGARYTTSCGPWRNARAIQMEFARSGRHSVRRRLNDAFIIESTRDWINSTAERRAALGTARQQRGQRGRILSSPLFPRGLRNCVDRIAQQFTQRFDYRCRLNLHALKKPRARGLGVIEKTSEEEFYPLLFRDKLAPSCYSVLPQLFEGARKAAGFHYVKS